MAGVRAGGIVDSRGRGSIVRAFSGRVYQPARLWTSTVDGRYFRATKMLSADGRGTRGHLGQRTCEGWTDQATPNFNPSPFSWCAPCTIQIEMRLLAWCTYSPLARKCAMSTNPCGTVSTVCPTLEGARAQDVGLRRSTTGSWSRHARVRATRGVGPC